VPISKSADTGLGCDTGAGVGVSCKSDSGPANE